MTIQTGDTLMVVITNAAGRALLTKKIIGSTQINVIALASGVYYVQNKTTCEARKLVLRIKTLSEIQVLSSVNKNAAAVHK